MAAFYCPLSCPITFNPIIKHLLSLALGQFGKSHKRSEPTTFSMSSAQVPAWAAAAPAPSTVVGLQPGPYWGGEDSSGTIPTSHIKAPTLRAPLAVKSQACASSSPCLCSLLSGTACQTLICSTLLQPVCYCTLSWARSCTSLVCFIFPPKIHGSAPY